VLPQHLADLADEILFGFRQLEGTSVGLGSLVQLLELSLASLERLASG